MFGLDGWRFTVSLPPLSWRLEPIPRERNSPGSEEALMCRFLQLNENKIKKEKEKEEYQSIDMDGWIMACHVFETRL